MMQIDWNKIRHYMIDKGIRSDAQLARSANVHPNTMGKPGSFRSDTVDRIAKFLGCNPLDLIMVVSEHVDTVEDMVESLKAE